MQISTKISLDVLLKNEQEALLLLNKVNGDDAEDFYVTGISDGLTKCNNLIVNEIVALQDGVNVELYKPNVINHQYVKTSRKTIVAGDMVVIDGIEYNLVCTYNKYNLFSLATNKVYFELEITSIQEILDLLKDNSVEYEIYRLV